MKTYDVAEQPSTKTYTVMDVLLDPRDKLFLSGMMSLLGTQEPSMAGVYGMIKKRIVASTDKPFMVSQDEADLLTQALEAGINLIKANTAAFNTEATQIKQTVITEALSRIKEKLAHGTTRTIEVYQRTKDLQGQDEGRSAGQGDSLPGGGGCSTDARGASGSDPVTGRREGDGVCGTEQG